MQPGWSLVKMCLASGLALGLSATAHAQVAKPVIGVESVKGGNSEVPNLRTMIETAIINTNRFTVMSAGQIQALEKSETLCAAGMTWRNGKCVKGKVVVPDYRISATVTSAGATRSSGINVGQLFTKDKLPSCVTLEPYLALDIRVTSSSNQIQAGESISLKGAKVSACDGKDPNASGSFDVLMRQVANRVSQKLVLTSFPIEVVDLQPGNKIMLTYGEDVLPLGQQISIFRKGPVRKDSSGREFPTEISIATAQIVSLAPTSSIAEIYCTVGGASPQHGDIARLAPRNLRRQRPAKGSSVPGECR